MQSDTNWFFELLQGYFADQIAWANKQMMAIWTWKMLVYVILFILLCIIVRNAFIKGSELISRPRRRAPDSEA